MNYIHVVSPTDILGSGQGTINFLHFFTKHNIFQNNCKSLFINDITRNSSRPCNFLYLFQIISFGLIEFLENIQEPIKGITGLQRKLNFKDFISMFHQSDSMTIVPLQTRLSKRNNATACFKALQNANKQFHNRIYTLRLHVKAETAQ